MYSKKYLQIRKCKFLWKLESVPQLLRGNGGGEREKGRGCAGQGGEEKPLNDLYVNSEDVQYY